MKYIHILILLGAYTFSNGAVVNKIEIYHVGIEDKPFYTIYLYDTICGDTPKSYRDIFIEDKSVYEQICHDLKEDYTGKLDSISSDYGTFCVAFYQDNTLKSQLYLNREASTYLFTNLSSHLVSNKFYDYKKMINSMIRRLL